MKKKLLIGFEIAFITPLQVPVFPLSSYTEVFHTKLISLVPGTSSPLPRVVDVKHQRRLPLKHDPLDFLYLTRN